MIDKRLLYELSVSDVTVLSGIRPSGRSSDHSYGRKKHGLLFIFWGEASFYCEDGKSLVAGDKELIYIPKGLRYRMKYSAPSTKYVLINFTFYCSFSCEQSGSFNAFLNQSTTSKFYHVQNRNFNTFLHFRIKVMRSIAWHNKNLCSHSPKHHSALHKLWNRIFIVMDNC